MGGFETTAQSIGFALLQLAQNSHMQEKLREEVSAYPNATYDDYQNKMPYLDAVVKERYKKNT
jgi:cytochrome P450